MGRTIPKSDAGFDLKQSMISEAAQNNIEKWHLDAEWLETEFELKKRVWDNAWADYLNPETRTRIITFAKQTARKNYDPALRKLVKMLISNPRIHIEELKAAGIETPSYSRRSTPIATTYPVYTIDSSMIRRLKIYFQDLNSLRRAKPYGQHGAEIRWQILSSPPTSVNDLIHSAFDTHSPFMLTFDDTDRGKTVYFCLCWENTRGEKGPWSEIVSAVIP
jgi:hypothetical protein